MAVGPRRKQYYLHNFLASQPDMNFHNPEVQQAHLDACASGSRAASTACAWMPATSTSTTRSCAAIRRPPRATPPPRTDVNPYGMQSHIYDKTQPRTCAFLQKIRTLLNEFGAVAIGEVGADDALGVMAEYTADGDKLHMAYSFNLLTPQFSAAHIRKQVEEFEARVRAAGPPGRSVTTTRPRDDALGRRQADAGAGQAGAGDAAVAERHPCLYQGDELALTEADVPFELLQDPYGITFWPEFKGRDGCRTPIPWTDESRTPASPPARRGCRWPSRTRSAASVFRSRSSTLAQA